tara:strand:+ start:301 stop:855 length:555 start_codon:yes stop_codon:yes gene_type:complete
MNKTLVFTILIIIVLIISNLSTKRYYYFLPTIPIYPNNKLEVQEVKKYINNRTQSDIDFFYKTNKSVSAAFLPYVKENLKELNSIIHEPNIIILSFKYFFNRARPNQIDSTIEPLNISTAQTPAYPAGHAFQAYYLAKKLSKKYPHLTKIFNEIANECDITRVKAGLHYPSDGNFARYLVNKLY